MNETERMAQFWLKQHLALFGLSRNPTAISRQIYDLLNRKGYRLYPINPHVDRIDDIECYRSLSDVKQQLEGAIIVTNPEVTSEIVRQCLAREITDLWFQYHTINDEIKHFCEAYGINYFYSCALTYHREVAFSHSVQRVFHRLLKRT
ncbi:MAG: CoA-binding protein [candidate division KSB1 bacterium]|nr:CoA-binding protein [candidate division KSB1 bacterium]